MTDNRLAPGYDPFLAFRPTSNMGVASPLSDLSSSGRGTTYPNSLFQIPTAIPSANDASHLARLLGASGGKNARPWNALSAVPESISQPEPMPVETFDRYYPSQGLLRDPLNYRQNEFDPDRDPFGYLPRGRMSDAARPAAGMLWGALSGPLGYREVGPSEGLSLNMQGAYNPFFGPQSLFGRVGASYRY